MTNLPPPASPTVPPPPQDKLVPLMLTVIIAVLGVLGYTVTKAPGPTCPPPGFTLAQLPAPAVMVPLRDAGAHPH